MDAAIAGSMMALGICTMSSAASERVIECATVKAVTTFTTGHNRRAHSTTAARKAMWS